MVPQVDTQLERNPKIHATAPHKLQNSPHTLEEALFRCSVSKESPRFPWNSKQSSRRFTKLQKSPKIPVRTGEER